MDTIEESKVGSAMQVDDELPVRDSGSSWVNSGRQIDHIMTPGSQPWNLPSCIFAREYCGLSYQSKIRSYLDGSFVTSSSWYLKDYLNAPSTISTISIAISRDGEFIATSHGDHTVKVFKFQTAEIYRVLRGHPRTPWTVKFHPLDSNIIASGCLGGDVRVWNVEQGVCTNSINMESSIISIAFHPQGDMLAVSCGYVLVMWDYRHMMPAAYGGYAPGEDPNYDWKCIRHPRNIRAVMFHPSGEFLFVAAPDHPKTAVNSTANILRLYAVPCVILNIASGTDDSEGDTLDLWTMPTVLPEVHLYSDGGLDISQDGQYLLSCSMLCVHPSDLRSSVSEASAVGVASAKAKSALANRSIPAQSATVSGAGKQATSDCTNSKSWIPSWFPSLSGLLDGQHQQFEQAQTAQQHAAGRSMGHDSGNDSSSSSSSINNSCSNEPCSGLSINSAAESKPGQPSNLPLATSQHSSDEGGGRDELDQSCEEDTENRIPLLLDTKRGDVAPEGWIYKEFVCIFHLTYDLTKPKVVQFKPITMNLMKAVTSTKFSPSSAYALIGFGVRHDGIVLDHENGNVTCEILQWNKTGYEMSTAGKILSEEDEVNIAQWHSVTGMGIVYGTKRGVVKACLRSGFHDNDSHADEKA